MLAASAGALFAVLMLLRRRRARLRGRRLEQHFAWQSARWRYWSVWLVVVIGVMGALDDGVRTSEIAASAVLVSLWTLVGVLLHPERRAEDAQTRLRH